MAEYIEREAVLDYIDHMPSELTHDGRRMIRRIRLTEYITDSIPAADVEPVVRCADCKHNNACLTQAFVEDESRVPFDRNTFFCADGKRDDARWWRDG